MRRILEVFWLALERLRNYRALVMWVLVGLTVALTFTLSIVLYVDAVNTAILQRELDENAYGIRLRYLGAWEGNIDWATVEASTATLESQFVPTVGLPIQQQMRFVSSGRWNTALNPSGQGLGSFPIGTLDGFLDKIVLTQGTWPAVPATEGALPVMISENMMFRTGIQLGDVLQVARAGVDRQLVEVVALWRPRDSADTSWVLPIRFFDEVLLTDVESLWAVTDGLETPVEEVDWQVVFNGNAVRAVEIAALMDAYTTAETHMTSTLPGVNMDVSPLDNLARFRQGVRDLQGQLVLIMLPVAGLIVYFVLTLANMLATQQQQEDLLLNSRGMSRWRLLRLHACIWLFIGMVAYAISLTLAPRLVYVIASTHAFLDFSGEVDGLAVRYTLQVLLIGGAGAALAMLVGLLISWRTTRQTLNQMKRAQARTAQPWWQRYYLDLLLSLPAVYTWYTLQADGGLAAEATNPFSDPLVFMAPSLFALAGTLLFLRVLPLLLRAIGVGLYLSTNIAFLMSVREMTRSRWRYQGTILLMAFTLSLSGFTASMASTLDQSLHDVIAYRVGAEHVLVLAADVQTEGDTNSSGETEVSITGYNILPIENLFTLDEVLAASRVGHYDAELVLPNQRLVGKWIGVDRWALADVAHFRDDYAALPIADLMNLLAQDRSGVLISRTTSESHNLQVGQLITVRLKALNETFETTVPILGMMDYFPTLDPTDGFFLIGNIDPIFELAGSPLPHNIWLSLDADADWTRVQSQVSGLGYPVLRWLETSQDIADAEADPARRGVLGFLSVGFIASICLTLINMLIQITAAFRAQANQLGVLRAMGLSKSSVVLYILSTQGVVSGGGIVAGTVLGLVTTLVFLPLLDFSSGLPPYLIRVAWDDIGAVYLLFALVVFSITVISTIAFSRQQTSKLVKLGDA